LVNNSINSNPAVVFDGTNDDLRITNGILQNLTYSDVYVYTVAKTQQVKAAKYFQEANATGGLMNLYIPWSDANLYWDAGDAGANNRLVVNWGGAINTPYLWSVGGSTGSTPSGVKQDIFRNALRIANDNTMNSFTGNNSLFYLGSQAGTNYYNGEMSEVIIITSALTASQQQRIHSYLAVKYGITLSQATPQNYVTADGSIIYDAVTTNSGYRSDIAGIGRDDASALDQRKSQSVNTRSIVQMDKGSAFSNDKDFLMWGSNGNPLTGITTGAYPGFTYRTNRIWRTDISGTPGTVTINVDLSDGIYNTGNAADYRLIKKTANTDFSTGATALVGTLVGNTLTFTSVTLADGEYFSLALAFVPAPGGVVSNMHYWLKADLGVTGTTNASAWADQSGTGIVLQNTAANQPTIMNNRINFNPAIQFDGSNDQLVQTGGIMRTATYTDFNAFMVTRTNTVTASSVFFETQAAGGRINVHGPWSDNTLYWDAGAAGAPHRLSVNWGGTTGTNYLWNYTASTTATPSGARQDIYRNGLRIANDNTMASFTGNGSNFVVGTGSGFYNGEIAELTFYRGPITLDQLQRIQSYLAVKYGIALDQTVAQHYFASDWNGSTGTRIWDATAAGTYRTDIAAIGRDDNSSLNQKQSASINTGNILIIGNTDIATDNISNSNNFSANRSFFSWAHNNTAISGQGVTDFGTTVNAEIIVTRIARAWFTRETGTVGTLKLRFNVSNVLGVGGVAGENDLADVRLLVDGDGAFATGTTSVSPSTFNNSTDIVEFDHDFATGTGFYFSLGSVNLGTAPLPVELISFEAAPATEGVVVKWVTASELNNDYFSVQVSTDAETWHSVSEVDGQGTKQTETRYEIVDEAPYMGSSYYRLKQVDFDEKVTYSKVVTVRYQTDGIEIFPNPSNGKEVTIEINSGLGENVIVDVSNLQGQSLHTYTIDNTGSHKQTHKTDCSVWSSGVYVVSVQVAERVYRAKLVINR